MGKKDERPDWDEYFMGIAREVAKRATCDRGKSGSVIVKDKRILATGYVGSPSGLPHCNEAGHLMKSVYDKDGKEHKHCIRTTHAEQNAIVQAAKHGVAIDGGTLYSKMVPCHTCTKMLITAGIKRVVCEKRYHDDKFSLEMMKQAGVDLKILNNEVEKYDDQ